MDRQVLRRELRAKAEEAIEKAMDAVEAAPDGQWIAGSEWVVRDAFLELTRECFQAIVQAKVDADPGAAAGVFSPGTGHPPAVQGRAARNRADRGR